MDRKVLEASSLSLSFSISLCLSLSPLYVSLSPLCLFVSSLCLFVSSVSLSLYLSTYLSVYLFIYLFHSISLSVYLPGCLSTLYLSVCLSVWFCACHKHVLCAAPLLCEHLNFPSTSAPSLRRFCKSVWDMCFAPQSCALFGFQNALCATAACSFSSLIRPDGSAPAALARDRPEPRNIAKNTAFRILTFSRTFFF